MCLYLLQGWFVIDVVAAIPFDLLLFNSQGDEVCKIDDVDQSVRR